MSHVRTWNIAKVKYAELFVLDSCMLTVVLWSMARALCNRLMIVNVFMVRMLCNLHCRMFCYVFHLRINHLPLNVAICAS